MPDVHKQIGWLGEAPEELEPRATPKYGPGGRVLHDCDRAAHMPVRVQQALRRPGPLQLGYVSQLAGFGRVASACRWTDFGF